MKLRVNGAEISGGEAGRVIGCEIEEERLHKFPNLHLELCVPRAYRAKP